MFVFYVQIYIRRIYSYTLTIFNKTGDIMKQDYPSMKIINIFFQRELKRYFEDTVMFSSFELKHKLLFNSVGFPLVFPHLHL